jgi:uncharacterized membrane protein
LSTPTAIVLFALISIPVAGIALAFTFMGAWMVLPFAGLEIALVGVVLYNVMLEAEDHEHILITDSKIVVSTCSKRRETCHQLDRYWAKVSLEKVVARPGSLRLVLRSHGREIEVGAGLCDTIKMGLAEELRQRVGSVYAGTT